MRADRGRGPLRPGDLRLPAGTHPSAEAEVRAGSAGQLPVGESERLGRRPGCRMAWGGVGGGGTGRVSVPCGPFSSAGPGLHRRPLGPQLQAAPGAAGRPLPLLQRADFPGLRGGSPSPCLEGPGYCPGQSVASLEARLPPCKIPHSWLRFSLFAWGTSAFGSRCPRLLSGRPSSPEPQWLSRGGGLHRLRASNVRPPGGSTQPSHIVNL